MTDKHFEQKFNLLVHQARDRLAYTVITKTAAMRLIDEVENGTASPFDVAYFEYINKMIEHAVKFRASMARPNNCYLCSGLMIKPSGYAFVQAAKPLDDEVNWLMIMLFCDDCVNEPDFKPSLDRSIHANFGLMVDTDA